MGCLCYGAYERNRTGDLFLTKEVLYLLSYVGTNAPSRVPLRLSLQRAVWAHRRKKVPQLYHTQRERVKYFVLRGGYGAYERNRTGDLFLTKEVLYLLSYVGAKTRRKIA